LCSDDAGDPAARSCHAQAIAVLHTILDAAAGIVLALLVDTPPLTLVCVRLFLPIWIMGSGRHPDGIL
jgi:hypothetical protein